MLDVEIIRLSFFVAYKCITLKPDTQAGIALILLDSYLA